MQPSEEEGEREDCKWAFAGPRDYGAGSTVNSVRASCAIQTVSLSRHITLVPNFDQSCIYLLLANKVTVTKSM